MKVLVNGIGNIGTTVLSLLVRYKAVLEIEQIYALKNRVQHWQERDLEDLRAMGIELCTRETQSGFTPIDQVIPQIEYIFDCTNNGGGVRNKSWYSTFPKLKGACAQGSEKLFGTSFMTQVNDDVIRNAPFVHIVSCNTHSIASLLQTFAGQKLEQLESSDFVIVRRSEDLGNHERLVSANVVARHLDPHLGTHHSIDVLDLYKTLGIEFPVSSSDVTTPSQLMHGVRFHIRLQDNPNAQHLAKCIAQNPFVASSKKFDSNVIFERGRRWGHQGRIYNHAVILANNILINERSIMGWAFIPQEGNTLLSTLHAFLLQTGHPHTPRVMETLQRDLLRKEW
jgi:glyceraldehyde-3-phosphate dehydrogenase (NAD(P))